MDWPRFVSVLQGYPNARHAISPRCPDLWIEEAERRFGCMPPSTRQMLCEFNGARLFIAHGPLFTLFGIPNPEAQERPPIDLLRQSASWRKCMGGPGEWVIGWTNYGGLFVVMDNDAIREWDTADWRWLGPAVPYSDFMERLLREGDAFLCETGFA